MSIELDYEKIIENALEVAKNLIMEKPVEAEIILNQLLKACPDHPRGLMLLGITKQKMKDFEASIKLIERAIEIDPRNPDNYNNLALSYANLDQYEKSIEYLNKGLELSPDNYLFINNLALQYRQTGRHDVALSLLNKALSINNAPEVWCNMGGVYGEMKDLDNAERCFLKAIEVKPDLPAPHVDLAFTRHLRGDWRGGFEEYEWRFEHFTQFRFYHQAYDKARKWDGAEPLQGKRILLYGEQGLGDTVQFIRYCEDLKDRGAHTVVHCQDVLAPLMRRCEWVDEATTANIISAKDALPDYDYQCSIMSLPFLLKNYEVSGKPYIVPGAKLDFKDYDGCYKVGIAWAGSPAHPNDSTRSTFLRNFRGVHDIPGVKLFSLQVQSGRRVYAAGKRIVDYAEGCEDMRIVNMNPMIQSFDDTATILAGLDLVISVDTALVHLAGAMGKKCWALLPFNPDWRWRIDGPETAWYDSVRLFRQPKMHDWESVFQEVTGMVRKEVQ